MVVTNRDHHFPLRLMITSPFRQSPRFEIPHRISKDCLVHGSMEYSAKMLLNSEERWTKAMKLLLTNLRATIVQISAMRPSGV
ncbi:hypothetical protein ANCCAN_10239 [Ancylostoma caninum]|uniref:Atg6 BARA domain-containing protein n=1 Tax=Ancylostoma caninum TaxID=29170 RepID=A0A368GLJ6_ANCCA|nr:hypothetical protein ANCCAN_10239 [Ancylostoma caninum]